MGEWFALHTWPTGASFCTHRAGGVAEENWNRMGEWFALGPQRRGSCCDEFDPCGRGQPLPIGCIGWAAYKGLTCKSRNLWQCIKKALPAK
eukprot:1145072-Pelagomonas_calceolata.AAC.2